MFQATEHRANKILMNLVDLHNEKRLPKGKEDYLDQNIPSWRSLVTVQVDQEFWDVQK